MLNKITKSKLVVLKSNYIICDKHKNACCKVRLLVLPWLWAYRYHLSTQLRNRAIERFDNAESQTVVARCLNLSLSVVYKLWKLFPTTGSTSSWGQARATTSSDDWYLRLWVRRNKTATPSHLRTSLAAATGRLVLMSSVHRRLDKSSLYAND